MNLELSNPKTFLALLLFIGFFFSLVGLGYYEISSAIPSAGSSAGGYMILGLFIMFVAVMIYVLQHRDEIGF